MKFSRLSVPTLKEKPADAEIASHELLIRAGMMRPVAAGIYTMLPLGSLALDNIETIVCEEMKRAGAIEVVLPSLHPRDAWQQSGRWEEYGPEMMRLADRHDREFCLGPTAEELITSAVGRSAPSYRDLPANLFQIQTKFRDEPRPRFGLIRAREFRMMDAYSFHIGEADLDREYENMRSAYMRVARRCQVQVKIVQAATGLIGGDVSHEFMVVSEVGEDVLVYCERCDWGANAEMETHVPGRRFGGDGGDKPTDVHTPGLVSVEEVSNFLDARPTDVLKCVIYVVGGEPLAVFVPGYREVSEEKLAVYLGARDFHVMRDDEREQFPGVVAGFTGPVGLEGVRTLFDNEVRGASGLICGANKTDYHLRNVDEGRDFEAQPSANIGLAAPGDRCSLCGGELSIARGIEIGHIFKLGVKYTEPLKACFTDSDGETKPIIMGTYGIGTSRMLATVVEQHHDEGGIKWPRSIAPLPVHLMVINPEDGRQSNAAREIEVGLAGSGIEVLLDDREASPGVKFNDADLVGLPVQVVVGKRLPESGTVDLKVRYSGRRREVSLEEAVEKITEELERAT